MAFSFDSLSVESLTAAILLAVAIWSWRVARELRARSRVHLRFAAVLLAALAAALPVPSAGLAFNVMLLTASVGPGFKGNGSRSHYRALYPRLVCVRRVV